MILILSTRNIKCLLIIRFKFDISKKKPGIKQVGPNPEFGRIRIGGLDRGLVAPWARREHPPPLCGLGCGLAAHLPILTTFCD